VFFLKLPVDTGLGVEICLYIINVKNLLTELSGEIMFNKKPALHLSHALPGNIQQLAEPPKGRL